MFMKTLGKIKNIRIFIFMKATARVGLRKFSDTSPPRVSGSASSEENERLTLCTKT